MEELEKLVADYLAYLRSEHPSSNGCSHRERAIFEQALRVVCGPAIMEEIRERTSKIES